MTRGASLVLALLLGAVPAAWAHEAPYSFLNLGFLPGGLEGSLTTHVDDVAHELGAAAPDSLLKAARARSVGPALFDLMSKRLAIVGDGDTLRLSFVSAEPDSERKGIALRFTAPLTAVPSEVSVEARLFPYDPQHETYVNAYVADSLRNQDLIDARHPRIAFATGAAPRFAAVIQRFVPAGIHHIFIGPDHILFVIGLLLLGGSLGRLLRIVTGFTVAHSITLALATLGLLTPPARVIEPLIALSIVLVGLENLRALRRPGGRDRRGWLAFGFGLIHGFGFASVLREFGLPAQALGVALLGFNVGVELGQAAIVLATAPLLALVRQRSVSAGNRVALGGSVLVAVAGAFWFIERIFAA